MANQVDNGSNLTRKRFTHEALAEALLLDPMLSGKELSRMFGMTETWISIIRNSDAFRATLERRKGELVDPTLIATLDDRYRAMAARSVEVLIDKLSAPVNTISDDLALRAATLGATMFKTVAPPPVAPPESSIDKLADRLIALQQGFRNTTLQQTVTVDAVPL
jgi:hypothetical protein